MFEVTEVVPNELSDYASISYRLRLYVIPFDEHKRYDSSAFHGNRWHSKEVVISESATTAMVITNLNIDTIPLMQQGSLSTSIRMDITHVRGHGLLESQFAAAKMTGWNNTLEMIYYLEINFIGRDPNNIERDISKVTFPVIFTNVNVNIDQSNTVYNVTASLVSSVMNDYSYSKIPQNMVIGGGKNIVSFFNNFASKLNTIEKEKIDNKNISKPQLFHRFEIDSLFANAQVGSPNAQEATKSNKSLYSYDSDENSVSITNGSTIQSFIDNIMQNSPAIQSMVVDNEDFKYTHLVNPVVNVTGFDILSGKNTYEVKWQIIATYRRFYSSNTVSESEIAYKLFEAVRKMKLYDYMYTGLNTEVRNINFDINNLYYSKIMQYEEAHLQANKNQGKLGSTSTTTVDKKLQNKTTEPKKNPFEASFDNLLNIADQVVNNVVYVDDLDFDDFSYKFFDSKVIFNNGETLNTASDQSLNQKNKQYDFDLEYIRNSNNASFINAELKIKGDPYWILPPGLSLSDDARSMFTENVAIIRFSYPSNDMYSTDQTIKNESSYTGFYYITSVNSTFNNGKFEQTLKGFRETKLTPKILKEFLKYKGLS